MPRFKSLIIASLLILISRLASAQIGSPGGTIIIPSVQFITNPTFSGQSKFANGTVCTAPSITFTNDLTTGLTLSSAGDLRFCVSSGQKFQITGSGAFFSVATGTSSDNTLDLGAVAANRFRTGYFGTSVITPTVNATTIYQLNGTNGATGTCSDVTVIGGIVTTCVGTATTPSSANVGANSCGTTASSVTGNETTGLLTIGATSGTQCRITFPTAATNRRQCIVNNETTANLARTTYVDTTHTDFLGTFVGADKIAYVCSVY